MRPGHLKEFEKSSPRGHQSNKGSYISQQRSFVCQIRAIEGKKVSDSVWIPIHPILLLAIGIFVLGLKVRKKVINILLLLSESGQDQMKILHIIYLSTPEKIDFFPERIYNNKNG